VFFIAADLRFHRSLSVFASVDRARSVVFELATPILSAICRQLPSLLLLFQLFLACRRSCCLLEEAGVVPHCVAAVSLVFLSARRGAESWPEALSSSRLVSGACVLSAVSSSLCLWVQLRRVASVYGVFGVCSVPVGLVPLGPWRCACAPLWRLLASCFCFSPVGS